MVLICGPIDYDFIEGRFLIQIWCYTQSPHPVNIFYEGQGNRSDKLQMQHLTNMKVIEVSGST